MPYFKRLLTIVILCGCSALAAQTLKAGDLTVTLERTQPNANGWPQAGKLKFQRPNTPPLELETKRLGGAAMAQISPDGRWLSVVNVNNGFAQLWDTRTAERTFTFLAHDHFSYYARVAAFSPDSTRVVFYAFPKELSLWDTASGQCVKLLSDDRPMWNLADSSVFFSPDGKSFVVTGSGTAAQLFDTQSGTLLQTFDRPWSNLGTFWRGSMAAVFSADGSQLAVLYGGGEARLYDAQQSKAVAKATWATGKFRQGNRHWVGPLNLTGRHLTGRTPSGLGFNLDF